MGRKDTEPSNDLCRQLEKDEIYRDYPDLVAVRGHVLKVLSRHLPSLTTHPPLLICDAEAMKADLSHIALQEQRDLYHTPEESLMVYSPDLNAFMAQKQALQARLGTNHGKLQLIDMFAEEYIHAGTTHVDKKGLRTGFIRYPGLSQSKSSLKPAKIYEFLPSRTTLSAPLEVQGSILLTENVTRFLIQQLLDKLFPGIGDQYVASTIFQLTGTTSNILWIGEKLPAFTKLAVKALQAGDMRFLEGTDASGNSLQDALQTELTYPVHEITSIDTEGSKGFFSQFLYPDESIEQS